MKCFIFLVLFLVSSCLAIFFYFDTGDDPRVSLAETLNNTANTIKTESLSEKAALPGRSFVQNNRAAIPRPEPFPEKVTLLPVARRSAALHQKESAPEEDLEILAELLRVYQRACQSQPAGVNGDIMAALVGQNAKGVAVFPSTHPAFNREGALLDRWGTPYYFHSQSSTELEILSAGPDRLLWTRDDVSLSES